MSPSVDVWGSSSSSKYLYLFNHESPTLINRNVVLKTYVMRLLGDYIILLIWSRRLFGVLVLAYKFMWHIVPCFVCWEYYCNVSYHPNAFVVNISRTMNNGVCILVLWPCTINHALHSSVEAPGFYDCEYECPRSTVSSDETFRWSTNSNASLCSSPCISSLTIPFASS